MNPALIITIIEAAVKLAPGLIADIQSVLAKGDPKPEDWDALRAKVAGKTYDEYIKEAGGTPPSA